MGKFAAGKDAYGISDRSGFRYRLRDMRKEWNGLLVGKDEYEEKHPQIESVRHTIDAESLRDARPDIQIGEDFMAFVVYTNTGLGIIGTELNSFEATASLGTVTVTT
tara:strand:- start:793 stop:1113 length:321 start_codon:yes stop_codon:yes gene_type:complete